MIGSTTSSRPARLRLVLAVVVVGSLLGIFLALRRAATPMPAPVHPEEPTPAVFADLFTFFFLGRPPGNLAIRKTTPLLRANVFPQGERVGLRAQTTESVRAPFVVNLQFLAPRTREEIPALADDRQQFRIVPGLRTYCCLRMPEETGRYEVAVRVGDNLLVYFPVEVRERPPALEGGLIGP